MLGYKITSYVNNSLYCKINELSLGKFLSWIAPYYGLWCYICFQLFFSICHHHRTLGRCIINQAWVII